MADVQSHYRLVQSANIVINEAFFPFENGMRKWADKYGAGVPNPIHLFLQGLVANDSSYVTNEFDMVGGTPDSGHVLFGLDNFPVVGLTATKLKFRWHTEKQLFANDNFWVVVYQGKPNNVNSENASVGEEGQYWFEGAKATPTTFSVLAAFRAQATAADTWTDTELTINPALITDADDLWVTVEADGDAGSGKHKVSWMVLEITYPYALGETPTYKNYVNDLARFLVSVRQEGTKGSSKYCYRVVPFDSDGVDGPSSDEVFITDGNATLDATDHICLSWDDVTDASGYKVYRTCAPSGYGLGLLASIATNVGDCGGGGGGGVSGYKDDGSDCPNEGDCDDDPFSLDDLEGCQGETTVTYPSAETPS